MKRASIAVFVATAAGCSNLSLPEGAGRGLVSADQTPPAGAAVYERPEWQKGDRFVVRRGGVARLSFTVVEAGEDGYALLNDESGGLTRYTRVFAEIGEEQPGDPASIRLQEPADQLLHWPLWVGKRWSCHVLRKAPGEPALPLLVSYECDRAETVRVPAGEFSCLRVWRRARVAAEGVFLERTSLLWFAPEVGFIVRRLENGTVMELEAIHRQH